MKELIGVVVAAAALFVGTPMLKWIHHRVRGAALEKAKTGFPSLTELTTAICGEGKYRKIHEQRKKRSQRGSKDESNKQEQSGNESK